MVELRTVCRVGYDFIYIFVDLFVCVMNQDGRDEYRRHLHNCVSTKYDTSVAFVLRKEILADNEGKYCD